jgi:hypothetical protein
MAFQKIALTADEWTLIGDGVTEITFQVLGQNGVYINFNSSNTEPSEDFGLVYNYRQGELKKSVTDLTYKSNPNYVFARALTSTATIIVETS